MMLTRRTALIAGAAVALVSAAPPVLAGNVHDRAFNADETGLMLKGYDPVAYFTENAPIKGNPDFVARHEGVSYHFASAENRDLFNADPGKYAPAYGGFCAMGVAMGIKLDIKPELFRVVDDRLYLNTAEGPQKRWLSDIPGHIATANAKWPAIRDVPADQLEPN